MDCPIFLVQIPVVFADYTPSLNSDLYQTFNIFIMLAPKHALIIGGGLYACGALYMARNYYNNSSFRKIYVKADKAYEKVKIMHPPEEVAK